jgi:membrane protein implicated in regulation of membrane protease activity
LNERVNFWTVTLGAGATLVVLLGFSLLFVDPGSATWVVLLLSVAFLLVPIVGSAVVIYVGWRPFQRDEEDEDSVFD